MKKVLALILACALTALTGCGSDVATASVPLDGYVETEPLPVKVTPIDFEHDVDPLTKALAGMIHVYVFGYNYSAPGAETVEARLYEFDDGTWKEIFTPVQYPLPAEDGGIILQFDECFGSGLSCTLYSDAGIGSGGSWFGNESAPQHPDQSYVIPLNEDLEAVTGEDIPVAMQVLDSVSGTSIGLDNFFDIEPLMDKAATYAVTLCFR